jgi:hypothetical protein
MEVHCQRCEECGARAHNNILVREPGERPVVFVRCSVCGALVARYCLESYYEHARGLESSLRSIQGSVESGRRMLSELDAARRDALAGYERVIAALKEGGENS